MSSQTGRHSPVSLPEPIYQGPLEYVVRAVLQIAKEQRVRTGSSPEPRDSASVMGDVMPLLPLGSIGSSVAMSEVAASRSENSGPKLTVEARTPDGDMKLRVTVPGLTGNDARRFTLTRGSDLRPLQFDGQVVAEVDRRGATALHEEHRAAIYKTRGGKFVSEFSSLGHSGERTGRADVFGTLNEACDWFRPGPLTTELLKKLGRWEPEIIE